MVGHKMTGQKTRCLMETRTAKTLQEGVRCLDEYIEFLNNSIKICGYDSEQRVGIGHKLGDFGVNPLDGLPKKIFYVSGKYPLDIHSYEMEADGLKIPSLDLSVDYTIIFEGKNSRPNVRLISYGLGSVRLRFVKAPKLTGQFPGDLIEVRNCCMDLKDALGYICSPYAQKLFYESSKVESAF
jgi:hypothetical protein